MSLENISFEIHFRVSPQLYEIHTIRLFTLIVNDTSMVALLRIKYYSYYSDTLLTTDSNLAVTSIY